jgi:fused signal recognition particle receptor
MFSFFKKGLEKASHNITAAIGKLRGIPTAQDLEELEATLLQTDLGLETTKQVLKELSKENLKGHSAAETLKNVLREKLRGIAGNWEWKEGLNTILILGINGAGKTTTVAKLAHAFKTEGRKPIIGSADTFRAAANDQLSLWAGRAGVPLIESRTGADPAAVAFDALRAAKARSMDTLLIDTAGRLHTKERLMEELRKIDRAIKKVDQTAPQHTLLVLDATLGLNTLAQARAFAEALPLTGLIITKLDGSSKAGALVGLYQELKLPVYFAGLGEGLEDLRRFELEEYIEGLVG